MKTEEQKSTYLNLCVNKLIIFKSIDNGIIEQYKSSATYNSMTGKLQNKI